MLFSHYCAILVEGKREGEEESQKIDNLPVLATRRFGTLVMLSSQVNGLLLMEALNND